jgi:hypothetical protein
MTYEEAHKRANLVIHEVYEALENKDDRVAFRAAVRARLVTDEQFRADCEQCAITNLESWQATRH